MVRSVQNAQALQPKAGAVTESELHALMCASQGGDARSYHRLLKALTPRLRASIRTLMAGGRSDAAADAEEALQEALLAIHLKLDTWRPGAPVLPWARAIARYKAIDLMRLRVRTSTVPLDDENGPEVMREVGIDTKLDLVRVLGALPAYMRTSIEAVKVEGLSIGEAAERTGLSESAVKVGIHRGLNAIAAALGLPRPALSNRQHRP